MKRVYEGSDIVIDLGCLRYASADFKFYTWNKSNCVVKTKADVSEDGRIVLEWHELAKLEEGVLYVSYHVQTDNPSLADGKEDVYTERMLQYFLVTGNVEGSLDKGQGCFWGAIKGSISEQEDLNRLFAKKKELNNKVDTVLGKSLVSDEEITRLSKVHNYDDSQLKTRIKNIEEDMSVLAEILQRMEAKMDDSFVYNGDEIKSAGKFTSDKGDFILTIAAKNTENACDSVILNVQMKDSMTETSYPFYVGNNPVVLKSVNISSEAMQKYRFFWGVKENVI